MTDNWPSDRYTRSGTRRAGDDYQDAIALKLMMEWLRHPDRYAWQKVEADDAGALDDVVVCDKADNITAFQVKFSAHPDRPGDQYDWPDLLSQPTGKNGHKQSLLQKWAAAYRKLRTSHAHVRCVLVSNRRASEALHRTLTGGRKVDLSKVEDAAILDRITEQLGGLDAAKAFLDDFTLDLDAPSLSDLESDLRHQFLAEFTGREFDWSALKENVRRWVAHPDQPNSDGRILLRDIRISVGWRRRQRITEEYELPPDFAVPDRSWHVRLLNEIQSTTARTLVITGPPGSGKSTYLSFLFDELSARGVTVLRHHYYIPKQSTESRRAHESVAYELMYQVEDALPSELLEKLNSLPNSESLAKWIHGAARELHARQRSMVVIVDGLDHVIREDHQSTAVTALLDSILPPANGLTLIVGTQSLPDEVIPRRLLLNAPREGWIEIPRLTVAAIQEVLRHHSAEFALTDDDVHSHQTIYNSAVAIEEQTSGLPLLVKYLLATLLSSSKQCNPWAIKRVELAGHGAIETYYRELWSALSPGAKRILQLIVSGDLPWRRDWLGECLEPTGLHSHQYDSSFNEIIHLLQAPTGNVQVVHRSLTVFIREHCLDTDSDLILKKLSLTWIRNHAPDALRWAYAWTLSADIGDPSALIAGPDRAWVLDAFRKGRPLSRAVRILDRAATAALLAADCKRHVELRTLATYLFNAIAIRDDEIDRLEYPRMCVANNLGAQPECDRKSPAAILAIAEFSAETGRRDTISSLLGFVAKYSARRRATRAGSQELESAHHAQLRIAAIDDSIQDSTIVSFFNSIENPDRVVGYADVLGTALRAYRKVSRFRRLIGQFPVPAQTILDRHLAILLREEGAVYGERKPPKWNPAVALLANGAVSDGPALALASEEFERALERRPNTFGSSHNDTILCQAIENLLLAAIYDIRMDPHAPWRFSRPLASSWLNDLLDRMRAYAGEVASVLRSGGRVRFSGLYLALNGLPVPSFNKDEEAYRVNAALRKFLPRMAETTAMLSAPQLFSTPRIFRIYSAVPLPTSTAF